LDLKLVESIVRVGSVDHRADHVHVAGVRSDPEVRVAVDDWVNRNSCSGTCWQLIVICMELLLVTDAVGQATTHMSSKWLPA
jgi:hypothetical protein